MTMFDSLRNLFNTLFTEFRGLGLSIFATGLVVMALLTAFGGDENKQTFKRGFVTCLIGLIVFFLAKPIVTFIRGAL